MSWFHLPSNLRLPQNLTLCTSSLCPTPRKDGILYSRLIPFSLEHRFLDLFRDTGNPKASKVLCQTLRSWLWPLHQLQFKARRTWSIQDRGCFQSIDDPCHCDRRSQPFWQHQLKRDLSIILASPIQDTGVQGCSGSIADPGSSCLIVGSFSPVSIWRMTSGI